MVRDSYTEVSSRSWFGRLGGAAKGVVFGIILLLIGFGLLFWNEGRAVERYKTLQEGGGIVVSAVPDTVEPSNEGKLVHLSGKVSTDDILEDSVFGLRVSAIKLIRRVEMFQWQESSSSETRKKLGGGEETVTTYNYEQVWHEGLYDSSRFKQSAGHSNPVRMEYQSQTQIAEKVRIGAYNMPPFLVRKIGGEEAFYPEGEISRVADGANVHILPTGFYLGSNPNNPQIGDMRVGYSIVKPTEISLIAMQRGDTFEPYKARAGGTIALLQRGIHQAEAMFSKAQATNTILTWVLRVVGFFLMMAAINMILNPLVVFADVIPAIGSLLGVGTKAVSFLVAAVLSLLTIGIAWFFYRPLLGVGFLCLAGAVIFIILKKVKKAEPVKPPPIPPGAGGPPKPPQG